MGNPEQDARRQIDQLLVQAGWHVCDVVQANITAYRGVAIREFPLPGPSYQKTTLHVPQKNVVHVCSAVHAITARSQAHASATAPRATAWHIMTTLKYIWCFTSLNFRTCNEL